MVYPNVIFAGGGSRCFWQLGFWEGARKGGLDLGRNLRLVGSASAGCATATAAVLGRPYDALEIFKELTAANPRNVHWQNLWPGSEKPILPHSQMYRRALELFLADTPLEELNAAPLFFLMSGYPRFLGGPLGAAAGFFIYAVEKRVTGAVHPRWAGRVGYTPVIGSSRSCQSKDAFIDLVLASSCVPPVLPGGSHNGQRVLDGGLVDNVPVLLTQNHPEPTLVLLSRRYRDSLPTPKTGQEPAITYAQPSRPIGLDKFDYANPNGLQEVFDLGLEDGERFAASETVALSA